MKASELRIGVSWIYWCDNVPVQFNGTNIYGTGQFGIEDKKTMPQVRYGAYEFYQVAWDNLSPIQLTPEILEKCGFDYDASYEVPKVQKGNFILWDGFDGSFSANFGGLTRLDVYVKYLHQLQNLYFALTETELEVDISKLQSSPSK